MAGESTQSRFSLSLTCSLHADFCFPLFALAGMRIGLVRNFYDTIAEKLCAALGVSFIGRALRGALGGEA